MQTTTSADGTTIAYELSGSGSPIVFVSGAFNDRHTLAPVAAELASSHTVLCYDRRGRGDSGDVAPYAVEREIEDLAAVLSVVGGSAAVFGFSSGANLGLLAAARGVPVTSLIMYEVPFAFDDADRRPADLPARLSSLIAAGRRADAVTTFQLEGIGLPPEMVAGIRQAPFFPALEAIAHTVVYDAQVAGRPYDRPTPEMRAVDVPILVLTGKETWPVLARAAEELPSLLVNARAETVAGGENHTISPAETAAAVRDFLGG
ncbi:alpha/beta fold hydrolase [Jiangella mangrovi]|uniref:Pimeloyl-ACP methyl ester carboxylesterase n=1 Tax=Jiangella mangrovi TaxID=1524084 RepID=A0A7W9GP58_9ACTN|nr:alpha/beta hydrolase [Jiangella mangrovi]MBB5787487.1 pimeloyl-ACP methyl ester carboxylesterase [Jiangella mangrovi]